MIELKDFQKKAVKRMCKLSDVEKDIGGDKKTPIQLDAPTGSGKTIILCDFIKEMFKKNMSYTVLWASMGSGDLHKQSYHKLKSYLKGTAPVSLLDEQSISFGNLPSGEVIVLNWEQINSDNNVLVRERERVNFFDALSKTKSRNEVIVIIDESHYGKKTDSKIKSIIDNHFQDVCLVLASATPEDGLEVYPIKIDINEPIQAELIKKDILINQGLSLNHELDKDLRLLDQAMQQLNECEKAYRKEGSLVNPLLIIQLPNGKHGESIRPKIEQALKEKYEIDMQNHKLAVLLDNEKSNVDQIEKPDHAAKVLFFKEAVATGWDCPRAQILLKYRDESKSFSFEKQILGRIFRMPEQKHYASDVLNHAYVYIFANSYETAQAIKNSGFEGVAKSSGKLKPGIAIDWPMQLVKKNQPILENQDEEKIVKLINPLLSQILQKEKKNYQLEYAETKLSMKVEIEETETKTIDTKLDALARKKEINKLAQKVSLEISKERDLKISNQKVQSWIYDCGEELNLNHQDIDQVWLAYPEEVHHSVVYGYNEWHIVNTSRYSKSTDKLDVAFNLHNLFSFYEQKNTHKNKLQEVWAYDCSGVLPLNSASGNEKLFYDWMEENIDRIEWWTKNGTNPGVDFSLVYEGLDDSYHHFFPDMMIKWKSGSYGVYEIKDARGNHDEKEILKKKIKKLLDWSKEQSKHGVEFEAGIVYPYHNEWKIIKPKGDRYEGLGEKLCEWAAPASEKLMPK